MNQETVKESLRMLTGYPHIALTSRGNVAIKEALKIAKEKGKTKCVLLNQGGWITYTQFAKKLGFEITELKTNDCKIDMKELDLILDEHSVFLLHSLSGYWYKQPMEEIYEICKYNNALLINDCCGSISENPLLYGDYLVCSFGRWKPINHGSGGFIASNEKLSLKDVDIEKSEELQGKITEVKNRVESLNKKSLQIMRDLQSPVLNTNEDLNLVVITTFVTEVEKQKIIGYCNDNNLPFTECPRMIRSLKKAICIEIKQLNLL
jgi:dTDP-4-amino-4,6-dideoxygalactose transaminase